LVASLTLVTVLAACVPQSPDAAPTAGAPAAAARFAAPVRLTADGAPLGAQLLYPSPRLHDIDQDGVLELVVGDLRGRVLVAEKVGDEPAAWSALEPFQTDGRDLKFNNW
jgi:hypothetical protein